MVQHMHDASNRAAPAFYAPNMATDSIGPVGYVGIGGSERLKGFINIRVDSDQSIRNTVGVVQHGKQMIENGDCTRLGYGQASRLSIRLVASDSCIGALSEELAKVGANVEAELPMHGRNHGYSIVYIGFNSSERGPSMHDSQLCVRNLQNALELTQDYTELQRRLNEVSAAGHEVQVFNGNAVNDLRSGMGIRTASMTELLIEAFGYDEAGAMRLMTNNGTVLAVATERGGNEAIAMSVIESTLVAFDGRSIRLAELTDCVVRSDYRNNGLGRGLILSTVTGLVNNHVRMNINEYDVLFAEANLRRSGMLETFTLQGWNYRGTLPNHAEIEGRLKSLAVMDISNEALVKASEYASLLRLRC